MWYGSPMKLWHDDIRRPPDNSWVWARTNKAARYWLQNYRCIEISLDHDLGLEDEDPDAEGAIYGRGRSEETGLDLVDYMIQSETVPPRVTIHSWNPPGAQRMEMTLEANGYQCVRQPYRAYAPDVTLPAQRRPTSRRRLSAEDY